MVETFDLYRAYGERKALDGLTFKAGEGEIYGILGPNGCGKSTLFRILCTLERPDSGRAVVGGFDTAKSASKVRGTIGVVFQNGSLDGRLTAEENLRAQGKLQGLSGRALDERVTELLGGFGLEDRRGDEVRTLSGGLRRKVEIAKALIHRPAVLLLDEASSGLDPSARLEMWAALREARESMGMTVLFTTHLMDEAEQATRLLLVARGRAVAEGEPAGLKKSVGGDVVELEAGGGFGAELGQRFGVETVEAAGRVRVTVETGHRFIAEAFEAFPGRIQSAALHRPTLEDVFLKLAGEGLTQGEEGRRA